MAVHDSSVKSAFLNNPSVFLAGWQLIFWVSYPLFFGWPTLTVLPVGHHLASLLVWPIGLTCTSHQFEYILYDYHIFHWEQMYRNMNKFIIIILCNIFLLRLVGMSPSFKGCSFVNPEQIHFLLSCQILGCAKLTKSP